MIKPDTRYSNLSSTSHEDALADFGVLLAPEEEIVSAYDDREDMIVFTNRRMIVSLALGVMGKKKEITFIPYPSIRSFSVDTVDSQGSVSALTLLVADLGRLTLEFKPPLSSSKFAAEIGFRLGY